MMQPGISVVIPAFNRPALLLEAIASVDRQSFPATQIIVVDDGSSIPLTHCLAARQARPGLPSVLLLRQENAGPAAARNAGVRAAGGDLIAFLDDDDQWLPDKLARQVAVLAEHPELALLGCSTDTLVRHDRGALWPISIAKLLLRNWLLTPGVMVRREVFLDAGGFPEDMRYCEDYALWLTIALRAQCALLDSVLVYCGAGKPSFGASGLSGDLAAMYRGEREAVRRLHAQRGSGPLLPVLTDVLCLARHGRRLVVSASNRWRR